MDTEDRLERYRDADTWPAEQSLAAMLDSQMAAFDAVRQALPALARAAEAAADRLRREGRLVYAGAGASGRLAVQDGVELHPTFGWPRARLCYLIAGGERALVASIEGAEDDAAAALAAVDALALAASDVVVAVAASGRTTFTCAVQRARARPERSPSAWPTTRTRRSWMRPRFRCCWRPGRSSSPARPG